MTNAHLLPCPAFFINHRWLLWNLYCFPLAPSACISAPHKKAMPYPMHYPQTKKTLSPPPPQQQPRPPLPSIRVSAVSMIMVIWDLLVHEYLIWYRPFSLT
jgi:hypothetical protein